MDRDGISVFIWMFRWSEICKLMSEKCSNKVTQNVIMQL